MSRHSKRKRDGRKINTALDRYRKVQKINDAIAQLLDEASGNIKEAAVLAFKCDMKDAAEGLYDYKEGLDEVARYLRVSVTDALSQMEMKLEKTGGKNDTDKEKHNSRGRNKAYHPRTLSAGCR